ncbi:MAG TPA: hypothetical protein DEQ17_03055 [Prevotella sp.]|nr:hypothetical protein [Prevotella sp.]
MDLLTTFAKISANLPNILIKSRSADVDTGIPWDKERQELIGRVRWLCQEVIVSPDELIKKMPKELGRFYGGQWAIYSCCYTAVALANLCRIYPDIKEEMLPKIEALIGLTDTPVIRYYDTMMWKEDAMDGLDGPNDHMTYLSLLAWAITHYKFAGGDSRFDNLLEACCQSLHRNMLFSHDLNLRSFPNAPIFLPDMLYTIVALHNYELLYNNGKHQDVLSRWMEKAQTVWLDKETGLLASMLTQKLRKPKNKVRGSYTALNCSLLAFCANESFSRNQYELFKRLFVKKSPIFGIREYLDKSPMFSFDVDAGPILFGLSPSGTTFALGAATWLGDWEMRSRLLRTASIVGDTIMDKAQKQCHYRLGEIVICGEAVALGMRTMFNPQTLKK